MSDARAPAMNAERRGSLADHVELVSLALLLIGVVMVYSASSPYGARTGEVEATWRVVTVQLVKLGSAFALYLLGSRLGVDFFLRHSGKGLLIAVAALALVPLFGVTLNGSRRWFSIGGVSFQPAEMMKILLVLYLAARMGALGDGIRRFDRPILLLGTSVVPICGLLFLQPDFGTAVFVLCVSLLLWIIAGGRFSHLLTTGATCLAGFVIAALLFFPHVLDRFHKHAEPRVGDQVYQSLIALGSGGITGMGGGLGDGVGKLGFIPMVNSDFILANIGEEAGFLGTSLVVVLFMLLTIFGARLAAAEQRLDRFLLACGIVLSIAAQALINLVVVTRLGPTKGIALPFISAGGSALAFTLFGVGLLVHMARNPVASARTAAAAGRAPRTRLRSPQGVHSHG